MRRKAGGGLPFFVSRTSLLYSSKPVSSQCGLVRQQHCFSTACATTNDETSVDNYKGVPHRFLRESDHDNLDPNTFQRVDVKYDLESGKTLPKSTDVMFEIKSISENDETIQIEWKDGHVSSFALSWFQTAQAKFPKTTTNTTTQQQREEPFPPLTSIDAGGKTFWTDLTEQKVRDSSRLCIDFTHALTPEGMKQSLETLYEYGLLLVTDTPIDDEGAGVAALAASVSGGSVKNDNTSLLTHYLNNNQESATTTTTTILPNGTDGPYRTLYGGVWYTSSAVQTEGTSIADSAYGHDGLPLHTDMTYSTQPPGLQIFTMVQPAPEEGGKSVYVDGFGVARELFDLDKSAFATLANTKRLYHSRDVATGWYLQARGSVIETTPLECNDTDSSFSTQLVRIRHNDLDRLPDYYIETEQDYRALDHAHALWDDIINASRLEIALRPGETMLVANQRVMHGRCFFQTFQQARSVMGCYVSQDELSSRWRMLGYNVPI